MTVDGIARMYAHMSWADGRFLMLMKTLPPVQTRAAMRIFSHLLASERVWMLRLRGEDSGVQALWPEFALEEVTELAAINLGDYTNYLDALRDDDLTSEVHYNNQQGKSYRTEVGDILIHVAMHGSYHRGQIAAAVRAAGAEPINTDYITYVRQRSGGRE